MTRVGDHLGIGVREGLEMGIDVSGGLCPTNKVRHDPPRR